MSFNVVLMSGNGHVDKRLLTQWPVAHGSVSVSPEAPPFSPKGCPNQPRLAQTKVLPAKSQKSWANILSDAPTEEERRGEDSCLWVWHVALLCTFGCRYSVQLCRVG
ncbi:hypothetical protein H0G86_007756 [Trichoderma simmonsii]|uniref:Uncharacterized protein n=1 Tax=Trichoderma simmonsii TaxID=1491479 RepID=A0A8G0LH56_9HYPO|nr:hypothetical protein H0G86_007756 [Trichoderma simmonsii]